MAGGFGVRVGSSLTGTKVDATCAEFSAVAIRSAMAFALCAFVIHVRSRFALTECCIAMCATDTPGLMH